MKAVITAQFDLNIMDLLKKQMDIVHTGWGVTEHALTMKDLVAVMNDAQVLVTEIESCTKEVIEQCPKLKFIGCCRNNPVNIDVETATRHGIPVVFTPGRNARAVAEMTVAMMIILARQMDRAILDVRQGRWTPEARYSYLEYKGYELERKTVGILGLGAIGKLVKRLCEAFDMQVLVYDPYLEKEPHPEHEIYFVSLPDLLSQSDFVTVHVPDTPETMGMIGRQELKLMKSSAHLINTGRGKHVDQDALYEALKEKWIAGAALDVFYKEPLPKDHKFFSLDNILLMPHIAGATYEVITKHSQIIYDQIQNYFNHRPMQYLRNPEIFTNSK
jgi:D-3-phosphoglycerate dehydrogenase